MNVSWRGKYFPYSRIIFLSQLMSYFFDGTKKDLNAAANRSSCVSYTCQQAFIDLAKLLQSDWLLSAKTD